MEDGKAYGVWRMGEWDNGGLEEFLRNNGKGGKLSNEN